MRARPRAPALLGRHPLLPAGSAAKKSAIHTKGTVIEPGNASYYVPRLPTRDDDVLLR